MASLSCQVFASESGPIIFLSEVYTAGFEGTYLVCSRGRHQKMEFCCWNRLYLLLEWILELPHLWQTAGRVVNLVLIHS